MLESNEAVLQQLVRTRIMRFTLSPKLKLTPLYDVVKQYTSYHVNGCKPSINSSVILPRSDTDPALPYSDSDDSVVRC